MSSKISRVALGATALLLASCAHHPGGMRVAQADPWEKFNRGVYGFNKGLDKVAIKPATQVYRTVTPKAAQRGLRNFFNNVDEPFSAINSLLQGKPGDFIHTMGRFFINTVLGVGGLADHASDMGLEERPEDLGQTLAVWGVGSGPYLMLPFFGPSMVRDAVGVGAEFAGADPYRYFKSHIGLTTRQQQAGTVIEAIDKRSYLMDTTDTFLKTSLDDYTTLRSAFLQSRQSLIYDGAPPEEEPADAASLATPAPAPGVAPPDAGPPTPDAAEPPQPIDAMPGEPAAAPPAVPASAAETTTTTTTTTEGNTPK